MGYSSRRPGKVLVLSATNRTLRLQSAQVHQNWTVEDRKNKVLSDESGFLLWQQIIWTSLIYNPICLVSTVLAGDGVMV